MEILYCVFNFICPGADIIDTSALLNRTISIDMIVFSKLQNFKGT